MNKIHHCIVSNKPDHPNIELIRKDAVALGWNGVRILGDKTMTIGPPDHFGAKMTLMREHVETLPDMDIVLFTDAHDVRVIATPEEVLRAFYSFQTRIVISAEKNCYPNERAKEYYGTNRDTLYKYVNSGGYIGYVRDIKSLLYDEDLALTKHSDDQEAFTFLYLKYQLYPEFIKLDTQCKIFQTLYLANDDIDTETRRNRITGTTPLIYHGNGSSTTKGDPIYINHVCKWDVFPDTPLPSSSLSNRTEQEIIQKLYEACTYNLHVDVPILNQIQRDFHTHPVIHYLTGVYYTKHKNIYKASYHLKRSYTLSCLFTQPRFDLTELYLRFFEDANVEKYLRPIYHRETTNNPMTSQTEYCLNDQLHVCCLLAPYYERKKEKTKAHDMYLNLYQQLKRAEYKHLPPSKRYVFAECWKNICFGLGKTSTDPTAQAKYLNEALEDFQDFLKDGIGNEQQKEFLQNISIQIYTYKQQHGIRTKPDIPSNLRPPVIEEL